MEKEKPTHKISRAGVEVAIWVREGEEKGQFSLKFSKNYRTADEKMKSTQVFLPRDMLAVARVAELADLWMFERLQELRNV